MKKQTILKFLAAAVVSSNIFLSCKKDETVPVPNTVTRLLFDWKITNITTPKKLSPNTDSSLLKTCMSDDIIKFSSTGYDFQDGTARCDSSIFPYTKGAWGYKQATDSIQLGATDPGKYMSWKIVTINDSVLQVKYIDSLNPADKITKTISFKH
jgi:hypothetical protein